MRCVFIFLLLLLAPFQAARSQGLSSTVGGLQASPSAVGLQSIFWNPASISYIKGPSLETNLAMTGGWLIYDPYREGQQSADSVTTSLLAPTPFASFATPFFNNHWRFGYATFFPSGAYADFDEKSANRYDLIGGLYLPWTHQFTAAYQFNSKWSLGASFLWTVAFFETEFDVEIGQVVNEKADTDNATQRQSTSARLNIPMTHAHGFSGGIGALYRPNLQWSLGLSFYLPMVLDFQTTVFLDRPRLLGSAKAASEAVGFNARNESQATVRFEQAPLLNVGVRYQPYGYWKSDVFFRYEIGSLQRFNSIFFSKSNIEQLKGADLIGAKRQDSFVVGTLQTLSFWKNIEQGVYLSYSWNGVRDELLSVSRFGLNTLTTGVSARFRLSKKLKLGAEYSHSFMMERFVDNTIGSGMQGVDLVGQAPSDGRYRASADRAALSISYDF